MGIVFFKEQGMGGICLGFITLVNQQAFALLWIVLHYAKWE